VKRAVGYVIGLGCVTLLLGSGCGVLGGTDVVEGDHPTLVVGADRGDAMDALASGVLSDVAGCYGLTQRETHVDVVVVWPEGSSVRGTGTDAVVVLPDDIELAPGDEVSLGGGEVEPGSGDVPDNDCAAGVYFLANSPQDR
jgi:hypothetical protein